MDQKILERYPQIIKKNEIFVEFMSKDNIQKVRKINHLCSQELGFDEGKILLEKF
jgi:hypothetical protein